MSWTLPTARPGRRSGGAQACAQLRRQYPIYTLDVLYEGGTTWKAYADNGFGYVQYYTSANGIDWTGVAIDILGGTLQSWETSHNVAGEHVIKVGAYYVMFYGSGTHADNNQAIGMAMSADGQTWVKSKGNPLFTITGAPAWRDNRTYTPYVFQDGSDWKMYFTGKSAVGGIYSVGYATNPGPFTQVHDAVSVAGAGDTINVTPGTYSIASTVILDKALTISGPAVGGGGARLEAVTGLLTVFEIKSSNVVVQNLEITAVSAGTFGVPPDNELNTSLIKITTGTGMTGIAITGNAIYVPAQIGAMTTWNARGITAGGSTVTGLSITGNTICNTRNGVVIHYNNTATISDNTIYNTKGGIMNYTGSQADADNRTMSNNTWTTVHNEWDIVWNSGGGPYDQDYHKDVLLLSGANNDAYVLSLMTATATPTTITGNRSHVWVNSTTGTTIVKGANGNMNLPYQTIRLGVDAAVPGGTVYVTAGTYNEAVTINKPVTLQGAGAATTIIDGAGLGASVLVSIPSATGAITLDGFTIKNADNYQITLGGGAAVATITIAHNTIIANSASGQGYGLYGSNGEARVAFSNNVVSECTAHCFFLERWLGPSEVSYNTFTPSPLSGGGATATGHMNYRNVGSETDPHNVTTKQWIHHNTINANGCSGIIFFSSYGTSYNDPRYADGQFANVEISDNMITNVGDYSKGIQFEIDGDGGDIKNALIARNTISTQHPGSGTSRGIRILARATNTLITGNTISGFYRGIYQSYSYGVPGAVGPAGTTVHNNNITGSTLYGIENQYTGVANIVNAEYNFWGAVSGPLDPAGASECPPCDASSANDKNADGAGNGVTDNVDYCPWLGAPAGLLQSLIDAAAPGSTLTLDPVSYAGTGVVNKALTIVGQPGTIIYSGSPAFTVNHDDVTISNMTLNGAGWTEVASAIVVNAGVQRLYIHDMEIMNWPADGIHFDGAITDLKLIDNYIHNNSGHGVAFSATPGGVAQLYGNSFRNNGGAGVSALSPSSVTATYNEWGSYDGPNTGGDGTDGSVTSTPWTFGKVFADAVPPSPVYIREGLTVDVDIKVDGHELYGAQLSATFDPNYLEVVSLTDAGAGYLQGSQSCTKSFNNTAGTVTYYCTRSGLDGTLSSLGIKLLTITFRAKSISGSPVNTPINVTAGSVVLSSYNSGLGSINIHLDSVAGDSITILDTTTVSGQVDLQGRGDESGASVNPAAGVSFGYDAPAYTTGLWGSFSFSGMASDSYTVEVSRLLYLAATKTVAISGDTLTLPTVVLLGGNANNDGIVNIQDLSCIGFDFGNTPPSPTACGGGTNSSDVNADGTVNILDLVLAGGNYDRTSSPW